MNGSWISATATATTCSTVSVTRSAVSLPSKRGASRRTPSCSTSTANPTPRCPSTGRPRRCRPAYPNIAGTTASPSSAISSQLRMRARARHSDHHDRADQGSDRGEHPRAHRRLGELRDRVDVERDEDHPERSDRLGRELQLAPGEHPGAAEEHQRDDADDDAAQHVILEIRVEEGEDDGGDREQSGAGDGEHRLHGRARALGKRERQAGSDGRGGGAAAAAALGAATASGATASTGTRSRTCCRARSAWTAAFEAAQSWSAILPRRSAPQFRHCRSWRASTPHRGHVVASSRWRMASSLQGCGMGSV